MGISFFFSFLFFTWFALTCPREVIWKYRSNWWPLRVQSLLLQAGELVPYILMAKMLQQLQFSVGSFRKDWGTERLHNLLDCHGLASQLVLCRTKQEVSERWGRVGAEKISYQTSPKAPMPTGCKSVYLAANQQWTEKTRWGLKGRPNLLVISNVVPKIWARTNSAILADKQEASAKRNHKMVGIDEPRMKSLLTICSSGDWGKVQREGAKVDRIESWVSWSTFGTTSDEVHGFDDLPVAKSVSFPSSLKLIVNTDSSSDYYRFHSVLHLRKYFS